VTITITGENLMITKEAIEEILSKSMPLVDGYQTMIEKCIRMSGCSNFQGGSAVTLALLQTIFTCSAPGEAREDLDTFREIINKIFDKASEKFPVWDERRVQKYKQETDKAMDEFKKINQKPTRDAGDNIH